jgi:hypothetical protein
VPLGAVVVVGVAVEVVAVFVGDSIGSARAGVVMVRVRVRW